jgi:hypothetical protein
MGSFNTIANGISARPASLAASILPSSSAVGAS